MQKTLGLKKAQRNYHSKYRKKRDPDGFWYKTPSGDVIEKQSLKITCMLLPKRVSCKNRFKRIFRDYF